MFYLYVLLVFALVCFTYSFTCVGFSPFWRFPLSRPALFLFVWVVALLHVCFVLPFHFQFLIFDMLGFLNLKIVAVVTLYFLLFESFTCLVMLLCFTYWLFDFLTLHLWMFDFLFFDLSLFVRVTFLVLFWLFAFLNVCRAVFVYSVCFYLCFYLYFCLYFLLVCLLIFLLVFVYLYLFTCNCFYL